MTPLSLTIQNFLSFKEAKIRLDDTGLVSVQGENLDGNGASSNGSGKSSLFIAIRWCLYGETDKKMPSDQVVNSIAGKNCMVETHWVDEATNVEYLVSRYRKHTKHKNKLRVQIKHPGLDWVDKTLGKNDLTQQSVNQILGMDDTVFMASCFASQENPVDIPAMKDTELKKLLEDSLPIAKFDPLHKKYKDHLDNLKAEYDALEKKRTNREYSISINEKQLVDIINDQTKWRTDIDAVRSACAIKIRSLQKQLEELGSIEDTSPLNDLRAALQAKYRSLGVDALPLLETRLEGLKSQLGGMKGEANKCPTCGGSWQDKSHKERFENTYSAIVSAIEECEGKIEKLTENVALSAKVTDAINNLDTKIKNTCDNNLLISSTKRELDVEVVNLKRLSGDDPFKSSVDRISSELVEYKKNLVELNEAIDGLKPSIILYTNMVDVTSPKGFRYHLLESVTPELNAATNKYLAMLSDGKITAHWSTVTKLGSGEYREAFSIKVNHNGRTNFGSLSSGQKRKVRLACWFALQDMIANRASKNINLWVCDEVDHALDSAGIERLMSLLEEKAKDKKTVLVISHNNLKDWISNSITVKMKDDISTVSGFLNVS